MGSSRTLHQPGPTFLHLALGSRRPQVRPYSGTAWYWRGIYFLFENKGGDLFPKNLIFSSSINRRVINKIRLIKRWINNQHCFLGNACTGSILNCSKISIQLILIQQMNIFTFHFSGEDSEPVGSDVFLTCRIRYFFGRIQYLSILLLTT